MSYASLDEVKAHLRYDDDAGDEVLRAYLDAGTALIDSYITDTVTESMLPASKRHHCCCAAILMTIAMLKARQL